MIRSFSAAAAVLVLLSAASEPVSAQDGALGGALLGGTAGAIIGGATTGRAGGAAAGAVIGGAAGAIIGSQYDRPSGYFWSDNRCFYQRPDGRVVRVKRQYCS